MVVGEGAREVLRGITLIDSCSPSLGSEILGGSSSPHKYRKGWKVHNM